ncbi:MAG: Uma2 family endonuclease [Nostoc sp.]|uniref:Uma2 family endonuclease n=1 Tax=Nostoc sp. TaxID=1180 RepID=UPI002FEF2445
MLAPTYLVEVVSPGKVNEDRDYRYKRSEYAARGISEYWIVDADRARITLLTLVDGLYDEAVLSRNRHYSVTDFSNAEFDRRSSIDGWIGIIYDNNRITFLWHSSDIKYALSINLVET